MAKGRKTGGRKAGTPNKATRDIREAVRSLYEGNIENLGRWISEAGDGWEVPLIVKGIPVLDPETKKPVLVRVGKEPAKAAAIMAGLGEHFVPKLQRQEKSISDASDEELLQEIRKRRAAAEKVEGE